MQTGILAPVARGGPRINSRTGRAEVATVINERNRGTARRHEHSLKRPLRAVLLGSSALVGLVAAMPCAAWAGESYWVGPDGGLWSNAANWDPASVPGSTADVHVDSTNALVVDSSEAASSVFLGVGGANLQVLTGGDLSVNHSLEMIDTGKLSYSSPAQIVVQGDGAAGSAVLDVSDVTFGGANGFAASMIVEGGAHVTTSNTTTESNIGWGNGAASVVVRGLNSDWTDHNSGFYIGGGGSGAGALTVEDFATFASEKLYVNLPDNGGGTLTVSTNAGAVIGEASVDGTFNIESSAKADVSFLVIGTDDGYGHKGNGKVAVDNAKLTTGVMITGYGGTGALNLTNGGHITTGGFEVGSLAGSIGDVTIDDSTLDITAAFDTYIGNLGSGAVLVENGGKVTSGTGDMLVGFGADSIGKIEIKDSFSNWTGSGDFVFGGSGQGTLFVHDGGAFSTTGSVTLGSETGSQGTVTLSGASTSFLSNSALVVGRYGSASFEASDNAGANANSIIVGQQVGSEGDIHIASGASLTSATTLTVGSYGAGSVKLEDGAFLTNLGIAYLGETVGSQGAVEVGGGSSWHSGDTILVGQSGTGILTVSGGGTVKADNDLIIADISGSAGTVNVGAAAGDEPQAAGTIDTAQIKFGPGAGSLNFNHTESSYNFAPILTGQGTIRQMAGVTTLTADSSGLTGATHVTGGSLYVNNTLGGTLDVTGGLLGGSGTLTDSLAIGKGGTLAPGNSIGTLNVATTTFVAGSTYEVELNDGGFSAGVNNDFVNAAGVVTINGGMVFVRPANGTDSGSTYLPGAYTILTSASGVDGSFDSVNDSYAFLNFELSYDPHNVYLTSSMATSFCLSGMTANECATGDGVFSVGSGDLFDAVAVLFDTQAADALDLASGEIHASARTVQIEDSRFVRKAALDRVRQAFDAQGADTGAGSWAQGFGAIGGVDGDGNAAALDRSIGGFFAGADWEAYDNWAFGVLAGYSHSAFNVDDRASSGSADAYHLGMYAGTRWTSLAFRIGGAYSFSETGIDRQVAFPGFKDSESADYWSGTGQVFGELGYRLGSGSLAVEPFANVAWVTHATPGFSERGGAAAITAEADVVNATFTTLGVRGSAEIAAPDGMSATLDGAVGWRRILGDVTPGMTGSFAGGASFLIEGLPIAPDVLELEAGLDIKIAKASRLDIAYSGQVGSGVSSHAIKASLGISF